MPGYLLLLGVGEETPSAIGKIRAALNANSPEGAHSRKLISALTALCSAEDAARVGWLPESTVRPDIHEALELDIDRAGTIAVRWRTGMDDVLEAAT